MNVPSEKLCSRCQGLKPMEAFHRQVGGRGGRRAVCRDCRAAYDRIPERLAARRTPEARAAARAYYQRAPERRAAARASAEKWDGGDIPARWAAFVAAPSAEECWVWIGRHDKDGRPCFSVRGSKRMAFAYRVGFELLVGPIPDGFHAHHTCLDPGCVNPGHLEALSPADHRTAHGRAA